MPKPTEKDKKDNKGKKPTEEEKKAKKTEHKSIGKIRMGAKEMAIEITTNTTPNANGGYDTVVHIPNVQMSGNANK